MASYIKYEPVSNTTTASSAQQSQHQQQQQQVQSQKQAQVGAPLPSGISSSVASIIKHTRSVTSNKICDPVPGYDTLATNLMARVWNDIPELHDAPNLSAAKRISRKWAQGIPR